ncbi:MAG: O-antigen ligase family protein [Parcubacteria group bacterium]|nr:O-antigen ligase family protein [Parcubacteria group bacterium]MCR4342542.1 O-antigen ligase family protein [Patescibacteria group bacterium]
MKQKELKILSYVVRGGIFILPVIFLIVSSMFFFPFITGKNFFFRTVVEIIFLLWVVLAVFDKSYRPRKTPVLLALGATLFVLSLATIFGENPYRSFWSNFERMEGLVGHIHLFLYFIIAISSLRLKEDWLWLFRSIVAFGTLAILYAYFQLFGAFKIHQGSTRLDSTFGNASYLAIFVIFQLFILTILYLRSSDTKIKYLYAGLAVISLPILYYTATRGAILGFLVGLVTFGIVAGLLTKNKNVRRFSLGAIIVVVLATGLFIAVKDSSFVAKSPVLNRLSSISLTEKTVESRFLIWNMSIKGFKEHPILGWGPENYNLLFNKYYDPRLWGQEQWFDRAHNVFFDWLTTAGILGLLAYLSIFVTSLFMAWKLYKKGRMSIFEIAAIFAVFAAYGFHNLFVFDNLISYFLFFSILGYISYQYSEEGAISQKIDLSKNEPSLLGYSVVILAFMFVLTSLYFVNLKPALAAKNLIDTLRYSGTGQSSSVVLDNFKRVISLNTFGTAEAVDQLSDYANKARSSDNFSDEEKIKILNMATSEIDKQIERSPKDLRYYLFAGSLYNKSGQVEKSLERLTKAQALAPTKQAVYFALADTYVKANKPEDAFEAAEIAYNLDRDYGEAVKNFAIMAAIAKKQEYVNEIIEKYYYGKDIPSTNLATAYFMVGNFEKVKDTWIALVNSDPMNAQYHVSLAAAYSELGMKGEAIREIEEAIKLMPEFKAQGEYYINEIKAGRKP